MRHFLVRACGCSIELPGLFLTIGIFHKHMTIRDIWHTVWKDDCCKYRPLVPFPPIVNKSDTREINRECLFTYLYLSRIPATCKASNAMQFTSSVFRDVTPPIVVVVCCVTLQKNEDVKTPCCLLSARLYLTCRQKWRVVKYTSRGNAIIIKYLTSGTQYECLITQSWKSYDNYIRASLYN
jgi:hypothetical protein